MKLFIKISVVAVILVVVGVLVFLYTLDINQYKPALVAKISEQTGREFSITGDLEVVPSLSPSITMTGISLGNAGWATDDEMLSIGFVVARVSLLPLLSGVVHINQFILEDTNINLEKDAAGNGNWVMDTGATSSPAADAGESASLPPITIEEIEIRDARVVYRDGATGAITDFSVTEFTTAVTNPNEPISFRLDAEFNTLPLTFIGSVGSLNALMDGDNFAIDVSGWLSELELSAVGSIGNVMDMRGADIAFNARTESLDKLNDLADSELPEIGPFELAGTLKFDRADDMAIEGFKVQLGETVVNGSVAVNTGAEIPALTISLQSDLVDLTPFSSEPEEAPEFLFSREELPLQALSSINLDLSLATKLLKLPSLDLVNNNLTIRLQGGTLALNNESGLAGGRLNAALGLRPAPENTLILTADISGANIKLELLPHEEDRWFVGGLTEIVISGSGRGKSVADIMGAYNGSVLVKVGEATIPNSSIEMFGADILLSTFNNLNPLSSEESTTQLQCAVVNLPIVDGIIKLDRQIAIQTSKMFMVGSGEINLKTEALNLGVRPYAMEGMGLNLSSIAGAAKIGGTLANPKAEIDAANAIKTGVSAGAAVATGGLSLLAQGLFSKTGSDPEPCNTALGISSAVPSSSAEATAEPAQEASGGNVIDNVGNKLKGLFGR